MSLFGLMVAVFLLLHIPPLGRLGFLRSRRDKARAAMAAGFLFTGSLHLVTPERFVAMVPPFLPWPLELVYISGFFELAGAIGLLIPRLRRAAGWGLAALMLAIFPANIHVAVSGGSVEGLPSTPVYYWVRLLFQPVFIWWALWSTVPEKDGKVEPVDATEPAGFSS